MTGPIGRRERGRGRDVGGPDRLYIVRETQADGPVAPREPGADDGLDLVTLIVGRVGPTSGMGPEVAAILRMCRFPLSVAEISAYLVMPASSVRALLADLLAGGQVEAREPVTAGTVPDADILEAVMHGLQNL